MPILCFMQMKKSKGEKRLNHLNQQLKQFWEKQGFTKPTPIQEYVYPLILKGKDVVGISPTGTGKTLAYLLPVIEKTLPNHELQVLILAPSQELARQIGEVAKQWGKQKELQTLVLTGGVSQKRQFELLKKKPEIIIGTPSRLIELSSLKKLKLHQLKTVICDEADYLMQKEHLNTTRELLKKCPSRRQFICFSATKNEELEQIEHYVNTTPEWVVVNPDDYSIENQVTHAYLLTPTRKRVEQLRRLAQVKDFFALVFVRSIAELALVSEKLMFHHIPVAVLHSDHSKLNRQEALKQFKDGKVRFLLATDVAARGLDIDDLPAVVHYDLPEDASMYQHRSGRTGRMGKKGLVLSLINERDKRVLKSFTKESLEELACYAEQLVVASSLMSKEPSKKAGIQQKKKSEDSKKHSNRSTTQTKFTKKKSSKPKKVATKKLKRQRRGKKHDI